jgi:F0F1-type ATP synthase delta subunit
MKREALKPKQEETILSILTKIYNKLVEIEEKITKDEGEK